jgi:2-polyprenyl-3-methyl-5-hydroxy-6-metoxy-1,4-benzoquinol methylase
MSGNSMLNTPLTYIKDLLKSIILQRSLKYALKEQNLEELAAQLKRIVPDITDQYSGFKINNSYLEMNVRCLHAFQISLVAEVIERFDRSVIVDLGDSSGTHIQYIIGLYSKNKNIKCLSVNLDKQAVEKIKKKGLEAICARVEDLENYNITADIILCFELLEHLMDPSNFLYKLSLMSDAKYLIITVPYIRNSRVGLHHIRKQSKEESVSAENTHIFELNPDDWKLIMKHSGWKIVKEKVYLQYPKNRLLRIVKSAWKAVDYEGFYGIILQRDNTFSSRYIDW